MADITSLCNQALAAVGTRQAIASINEASNEARACLLQYDPTRKHLLRAAHWGFARVYAKFPVLRAHRSTPEALTPVGGGYWTGWDERYEPPPPWLYAYTVPGDCLAMRYIIPSPERGAPAVPFFSSPMEQHPGMGFSPMPKFELAQSTPPLNTFSKVNVLLTNFSQAIMCYTTDVTDSMLFDEGFSRAFVQGLAANMVTTLTGDLKLYDALLKTANSLILDARVKSANEGLNVMDSIPDWLRVRGVGPVAGTGPWIPEYGPLFGGSV